jgi:hypothetical protein
MRGETREDRRRSLWSARAQTGIHSQLRLYGLLVLLLPLFGGLQYLVQEAAPRSATTVAREAEAAASVEVVPVDRVVERVVFVPIDRMDDSAHAEADANAAPAVVAPVLAATSQPITVVASAPAPADVNPEPADAGSPSGTVVAAAETDPAPDPAQQAANPAPPAEAQPSTPPLMGIVAIVPRTPPAPRSAAPPVVTAPSDGPTEPEVAQDDDAPTDDATANVDPQTDEPAEARLPHVVVSTLGVSGSPDVVTYVAGRSGGRGPGNDAANGQPPSDANDPDAVIQQP